MYASARRFFARLASEIFLSSLQTEFFSELLVVLQREMGLDLLAGQNWGRRLVLYPSQV
jgi:hypothetical protein